MTLKKILCKACSYELKKSRLTAKKLIIIGFFLYIALENICLKRMNFDILPSNRLLTKQFIEPAVNHSNAINDY